jgi:hypothetical protein
MIKMGAEGNEELEKTSAMPILSNEATIFSI